MAILPVLQREGEKKKAQEREQDMEVTKNRDEGGIGERKKGRKKRRKGGN